MDVFSKQVISMRSEHLGTGKTAHGDDSESARVSVTTSFAT